MPAKKRASPAPGNIDDKQLAAFKILFEQARKAHRLQSKNASPKDPAHQEALTFAETRGWKWAFPLLEALRLTYGGNAQESLALLETLDPPASFLGEIHFLRGNAFRLLKDFDAAIDCYHKALDAPGYNNPDLAWHNLGIAYSEKQNFEAAIDCFGKAVSSSGHDLLGHSWHAMGIAYRGKNDFGAAIDCYRKALESPGYDAPGNSWHSMGIAYREKDDFVAAIDCYRKALESPGYDTPQTCRLNLSSNLRDAGRLDEAEKEIQGVLAEPDNEGQHDRARLLLSMVEARRRHIEPKPDEEALAAPTPQALEGGPEERMKKTLLGKETRYEEYLARPVDSHPDDLTILRGWSSSVTLLESGTDCQWQGGGYFLKWQGNGIVVDPGFDFLDNFHEAGFHGKEVHAVLVSHNHPDHNMDLGSLNDLGHELFRRSDEIPKALFALDEDTAATFPDDSPAHRGAPMKFTRGDHEIGRWLERPRDLPFTIEHFPVEHGDDVRHAMGLRLRLHRPDEGSDFVIGYTADGKFTESLVHQLQGVDLLIAHVSQPDTREFNDPEFLKEIHLGYNGVVKLVRAVKPKLTLVGEFWAGLADLRLDLISGIRLRSGVEAVLPACLGLSLRLPDLTVRCTSCRSQVPFARIKVTPPTQEFGLLGYLCPECIL